MRLLGFLGASWGPPGRLGRLLGAPEAENRAKTAYLHVFYRVSGGPRNRSVRLQGGNRGAFWAWGEPSRRGVSMPQGINVSRYQGHLETVGYESTIFNVSTTAPFAAWWHPCKGVPADFNGKSLILFNGNHRSFLMGDVISSLRAFRRARF